MGSTSYACEGKIEGCLQGDDSHRIEIGEGLWEWKDLIHSVLPGFFLRPSIVVQASPPEIVEARMYCSTAEYYGISERIGYFPVFFSKCSLNLMDEQKVVKMNYKIPWEPDHSWIMPEEGRPYAIFRPQVSVPISEAAFKIEFIYGIERSHYVSDEDLELLDSLVNSKGH
jgi:hypothetical protein